MSVKGILMRRGNAADFDESKLHAGEFAVSMDDRKVYIAFQDGDAEQVALKSDVDDVEHIARNALSESEFNAEQIERLDTWIGNVSWQTDEKFRKNLMYGNIEGTSPLTAKTLSGATELTLKGRCEQDTEDVLKDYVITNFFIYADEKEFTYVGDGARERTVYVKCKPNTHYVLTKSISSVSRMATTENVPVLNGKFTNFVTSITTTKLEITSGANDNYLTIQFFTDSATDFEISHYIEGAKVMPIPTPSAPIPIEYAHANDSTNLVDGNDIKNWQKYQTSSVLRKVYQLKPNTSYTISQIADRIYEGEHQAYIFCVSGNNISFTPSTANNGCTVGNPRTVTSDANGYITVGCYGEGANNYVMLNEGTSALPYEPFYKATKVESVGNNGIDLSKATYGKAMNDSGAIITPSDLNCFVSDYISVESNTDYTLSFVRKDTVTYTRIMGYDANNSLIGMILKKTNVSVGKEVDTFKTQSNCAYVRLSITYLAEEYRIEKGTVATPYLHTTVPLPCDLLGLPNAQDELKGNGVTRRVAHEILTTPYDVFSSGSGQTLKYARFAISNKPKISGSGTTQISPFALFSKFRNYSDYFYNMEIGDAKPYITGDGTNCIVVRVPNDCTTVELAKNYCGTFEVVYELATPTNAPADRIELPTYNEQTTFNADYCEISAYVAQNGLDVIDEKVKKVYSSEPRVVGKWFDGRDVLEVDFYKEGAWQDIDVAYLGIDLCVDVGGILYSSNASPIPYYYSTGNHSLPYYDGKAKKIKNLIGAEMAVAVRGCRITIQYVVASASGRSAEPMMLAEVEEDTED